MLGKTFKRTIAMGWVVTVSKTRHMCVNDEQSQAQTEFASSKLIFQ